MISDLAAVVGVLIGLGALLVAMRANSRSKQSNAIAARGLARETLVDERQREFRAVEWDARSEHLDGRWHFQLLNDGDTDAVSVTVVLMLNPARETHPIGDVPAKASVTFTSDRIDEWMAGAVEHEVIYPGYRVHWSSPLGQIDDQTFPIRTVDDFIG